MESTLEIPQRKTEHTCLPQPPVRPGPVGLPAPGAAAPPQRLRTPQHPTPATPHHRPVLTAGRPPSPSQGRGLGRAQTPLTGQRGRRCACGGDRAAAHPAQAPEAPSPPHEAAPQPGRPCSPGGGSGGPVHPGRGRLPLPRWMEVAPLPPRGGGRCGVQAHRTTSGVCGPPGRTVGVRGPVCPALRVTWLRSPGQGRVILSPRCLADAAWTGRGSRWTAPRGGAGARTDQAVG